MGFKSVGIDSREELSRTVAETFVEIGMEIVGNEQIFVHQFAGRLIDYEFLVETVAVSGLVVCVGYILDRDGLGAVGGAYPVGVG